MLIGGTATGNSEDAGQTWTSHTFDGGLAVDLTWDLNIVGVHLEGGRIFLLYTEDLGSNNRNLARAELSG